MKTSTTGPGKGTIHGLKGDLKSKKGQASNNPNREADRGNHKPSGRLKSMIRDIKKAFEM